MLPEGAGNRAPPAPTNGITVGTHPTNGPSVGVSARWELDHPLLGAADPRGVEHLEGVHGLLRRHLAVPVGRDSHPSSSAPTLMAAMLQALDVRDGDRVLEVRTGTRYNAALLCHRLGADRVTSVDVDPSLVEAARAQLASIGYSPHLVTADGAHGAPDRAPFDKIIATVALSGIPPAWRGQTAPGGTILLSLDLAGVRPRLGATSAMASCRTAARSASVSSHSISAPDVR